MRQNLPSRGGPKPRMLPSGQELAIQTKAGPKRGIYEISRDGSILARRVELPTWLGEIATSASRTSTLRDILSSEARPKPQEHVQESQGHIYLNPPIETGLRGASVGIDEEFIHKLENPEFKTLKFFVYTPGYTLVERWKISKEDFLAGCRRIEGKPPFMPQFMIELSRLEMSAS